MPNAWEIIRLRRQPPDPNYDADAARLPMVGRITSLRAARTGVFVTVTASADLAGLVYYHFWRDNRYLGRTPSGRWTLPFDPDESVVMHVRASRFSDYDPDESPPASLSGIITLEWIRSASTDVDHYRIELKQLPSGTFTEIDRVKHDGAWSYRIETDQLLDGIAYSLRIRPVDQLGNLGTLLTLVNHTVVRVPDEPSVAITFDNGTGKVMVDAA